MATDLRISELPASSPLNGLEISVIVQDGTTKRISISDLTEYINSLSVGTRYWKGNPASPVTGDIRETMVGTELQLQEYSGTSWDVRSSR